MRFPHTHSNFQECATAALLDTLAGMRFLLFVVGAILFFSPAVSQAQELVLDKITYAKARVLEVISQDIQPIPGTGVEQVFQNLRVEILSGPERGSVVSIENDYFGLSKGDLFYIARSVNELDGTDYYFVSERYRVPWLLGLFALFLGVVFAFGGKQGVRGLLALLASFLFIGLLLLPGILEGYSPILVSMGVASLIVVIGSYVTHGVSRTTSAAVIGMIVTIGITGLLAYFSLSLMQLTGFASEEAVSLNFNTRGSIDFAGLLLGGILIGLLGVLYDSAIGQAVAVEELLAVGQGVSRTEILRRALRIGREHIGALVNTLAIAYTGASLPLLLLLYNARSHVLLTINSELISTELVRIMVGSIGVVLAVPITTLVALSLLERNRPPHAMMPSNGEWRRHTH